MTATVVAGEDLHVGDTILDPVDGRTQHLITDLAEHWHFIGDHARRAHDGTGWGATICDHHTYQRLTFSPS